MAGVLDQEEIDALMGGLETGELDTQTSTDIGFGTRYNFNRHHYALQRLMEPLREVQEAYAEAIRDKTGQLASNSCEVKVDEMIVTDLAELAPRLATPCSLTVLNAAPIAMPMLLAIESDLVFDIVNRYFGGGSSLRKSRTTEKFSATEVQLSQLFVEDLIAELAPAWHNFLDIAPTVIGRESDPKHVDVLDDNVTLVATRFAVTFDSSEGGIWLLVPWKGLEPIREQLKITANQQALPSDPNWSANFVDGLEDAKVELVAVVAEQKIKLKNALQLKTGDVIAINDPKNIELKIGGIRLMRAQFGVHDGQLAAQILETLRSPMQRIK
ncbi:flagellar motor switch protein FliM [Litorivivens sp.]|uniref:flagellar motor switch protein FliM n=1 Tax=Litorivivens sp. TaxID=2020868 RepID=UPI003564FE52